MTRSSLDIPTVEDWSMMVTAFVGEWMDLEGYFPNLPEQAKVKRKDELQVGSASSLWSQLTDVFSSDVK
jgi:hypothetical protein